MLTATEKNLPGEDICIMVRAANDAGIYLVDCGFASGLTVRECHDVDVIFVSHTHIDHFVGFDTLFRHQLGSGKCIKVTGPPGIASQVHSKLRGYTWNLAEVGSISYEVAEIGTDGRIRRFRIDPPEWGLHEIDRGSAAPLYENEFFSVEYTLLDHNTPSVAYLFRAYDRVKMHLADGFKGGPWVNDLKAAHAAGNAEAEIRIGENTHRAGDLFHMIWVEPGFRLGVIMDHAATPENHAKIIELFGGADIVCIESFYKAEDAEFAKMNAHSYSTASGEVMRKAGVKNAYPIHFSRKYEAPQVEELIAEFEAAYQGIPV